MWLIAAFTNANLTEFHLKVCRTAAASTRLPNQLRLAQMQREVEKHLGGGDGDGHPVWMTSAGVLFSVFTPSLLVISLLNNHFSVLFFLTWVFCCHTTSRLVVGGLIYMFSVI